MTLRPPNPVPSAASLATAPPGRPLLPRAPLALLAAGLLAGGGGGPPPGTLAGGRAPKSPGDGRQGGRW
ncbi:hypothetical protein, partial [Komagataeibacter rhaeticus]|uniref:hypothetical protein n=1 Tax=Komagataeibacter rhaeticus TaxID=215221 RepID=UPI0039ED31CF